MKTTEIGDHSAADELILYAIERYRHAALPGAGYLGVIHATLAWESINLDGLRLINRRLAGLGYSRDEPDGTDLGRFVYFVGECVYGCPIDRMKGRDR